MRVHELAKELGMGSKDLIGICREHGIDVSNHMNALDDTQVETLRKAASGKTAAPKKAKKKPKAKERPKAKPKTKEKPKAKPKAKEKPKAEKREKPEPEAEPEPEKEPEREKKPEPKAAGAVVARPGMTVKELSALFGMKPNELIAKLMTLGVFATINEALDTDVIELVAAELGVTLETEGPPSEEAEEEEEEPVDPADLEPKAPVVTFLGHVDHGKTSLLDRIRETNVADGERGGITQHIGAYSVDAKGKRVVFLDTPGHEAFTAMRARGANVTDVVVLVVAADDGVMPQTEEAIDHAKAAGVPVIVAVNKTDLPNANPARVRQQLATAGLNPEEWGGETIVVDVSAKTGQNIDELLEMLALQTEILELKANPKKPARGTVIEVERSPKKGVLARFLVQEGTLRRGDTVLCGATYGKVRALKNHLGANMREAGPSTPVQVSGLQDVPEAGDKFRVMDDLQKARQKAQAQRRTRDEARSFRRKHITLENLYTSIAEGELKELRLIIKVDVQGSLGALEGALEQLGHEEVRLNILHRGVGGINESDILLADASDAIVMGFHVVCTPQAAALAEEKGVDVRTYSIIYEAVDSIKAALEGMLEPEKHEKVVGRLTVRATFKISRIGTVAGCYVESGIVSRRNNMRLVRNGVVTYDGALASLKRFKDDVSQVQNGYECGVRLVGFDDIKVGDSLEAYTIEKVAKTLA
jgi:translation initiation factor IF-2